MLWPACAASQRFDIKGGLFEEGRAAGAPFIGGFGRRHQVVAAVIGNCRADAVLVNGDGAPVGEDIFLGGLRVASQKSQVRQRGKGQKQDFKVAFIHVSGLLLLGCLFYGAGLQSAPAAL